MNRETILIVDDDPEFLRMAGFIVSSGGYKTLKAASGNDALQILGNEHVDLILLDLKMPDMDGYELCRQIREDVLLSHIPIIMLTCVDEMKSKIEGLEVGSDEYMIKPFESDELFVRIKNLLKRYTRELDTDHLTFLPGSSAINKEIQRRINIGTEFAALYLDIRNFKEFNEKYGFEKGDEVIKWFVQLLLDSVRLQKAGYDFIGHIGADDFIILTDAADIEDICKILVERFDSDISKFYDEVSRTKGFIILEDRAGNQWPYPIMSLVIGAVAVDKRQFSHFGQMGSIFEDLRSRCTDNKSAYYIDRRKE